MKTALGALIGMVAVAHAEQASAQAPEPGPAAWRVECSGNGKTLECRAVQQVFQRETRQLVVSVVERPAADGKTGAMAIQLPLGLNLTEPITVKVDNGAPERQPIQTCTNVGCFVAMTVSDKLLAAMRTGRDIRRILTNSAKRLGPGLRDDNFGSGLIDPLKAIQMADPRVSVAPTLRQR